MQFNVSFDTANSPSLATLTAGEQQALLATMNAAANIWSWYLTAANITLDLQIVIDDSLYSGNVLAEGGPSDFYNTGTTQGGKNVYDADTAIKLRTGTDRNGSDADLRVYLTSNAIRNLMYFKTDDYASVPSNRVDALSVFLHEIAHGLGLISVSGDASFPGITTFDTFVQGGTFTGTNAMNAYRQMTGSLAGVPLEPGSLDHLAESGATRTDDLSPAMEGGVNSHLSALDLGLMQDIGIAIRQPTSSNDIIHAVAGIALDLGGGDDAGYAVGGGSTIHGGTGNDNLFGERGNDQLYGDAGNDYLIGSIGSDLLDGGDGDDTLDGGANDDTLLGGDGFDTARYGGLASQYQIVRTGSAIQIRDLRPGSPEGTDTLQYVERVQWGDGSFTNLGTPPQLTTANVSLDADRTVALSSLFTVSDADGDAITQYQLWDSTGDGHSGFFIVGGIAQPPGRVITVSAADLANTYFHVGTVADNLQIRATDGSGWSAGDAAAWAPFTVTPILPAPPVPPVVTASDVTRATKTAMAFSDLFSVSDPAGRAITAYQVLETSNSGPADTGVIDGGSPSSGYLVLDGVVQTPFNFIDLTPDQMSRLTYVTGTGLGDYFKVRAFDGVAWSSATIDGATAFKVNLSGPLNHRPEWTLGTSIGPNSGFYTPLGQYAAQANQTLQPSQFSFAFDADGDAITLYEVIDNTANPLSGHFVVNGVAQAANTVLDLTPSQWALTSFVTGTVGDDLQMRVFDGKDWSATPFPPYKWVTGDFAWGALKITVPNIAPVAATSNKSMAHGQTLALSDLVSTSDAQGDTITRYQLWDSTRDPASGHFVINGVAKAAGTVIEVSAAQVSQTSFVAGTVGDNIQIRAFDGKDWSAADNAAWSPFTVSILPDVAPVVTTANVATQRNRTLALSSLFTVSDADGDSMTRYQLWDSNRDPDSGRFVVNGATQAAGTVIDITAAQLSQTSFVTGTAGDDLQIRAFDGVAWSAAENAAWSPFTVSVTPNHAPVVTTTNVAAQHDRGLSLSSLFTVSDADGDSMTRYQLWDSNRDPDSGHFLVNGVTQAAGTVIDITAAQLSQTSFVTGIAGDGLQIRAFDGVTWSAPETAAWSPFTVSVALNRVPVVTTQDVSAAPNQTIALSSLMTVNDPDSDAVIRYQLWDSSREATSGHFVVNGVAQAAGTVIDITAAQLPQTTFLTGTTGDALQVRAFDGRGWSAADNAAWSPFHIAT